MTLLNSDLPAAQIETPPINAKAITPADSDLDNFTRAIYIGGTGDLVVRVPGDLGDTGDITFSALPVGKTLTIVAKQIRSTGTTATNIVALF